MIKTFVAVIAMGILFACNNKKPQSVTMNDGSTLINALTEEEKKDGWQLLFDGVSTKGWHKYGGAPVGQAWKVQDSSLYLDAKKKDNWQIEGGGDIVTDEVFEDFHLKLDWKVARNGNSGIILYIHEDSAKYEWPWMTGPEMQVLDNDGHPDAKIQKHRAGDLYDLIASSKETVKPALEWNHVEIISKQGKLDFFLNGENVVSTTMWDENWRSLIANSKFKEMEGFGTYRQGRLGLQDHGDEVWFRNIRIKKLAN